MKKVIPAVLVLILLPPRVHGWQNTSRPPAPAQDKQELPADQHDKIILRKGAVSCLSITSSLSSATAKVHDRVMFQTKDDLSAGGLTVAGSGTQVGATVIKARKAGRHWGRDGKLSFVLDALPLVNGQTVPIREPREPKHHDYNWFDGGDEAPPGWFLFAILPLTFPFVIHDNFVEKGTEEIQSSDLCEVYEVARDVTLDKAEITRLQQPGHNWKGHVQQSIRQTVTEFSHEPSAANELAEFDFSTGKEEQIAKCTGCYSPVPCPTHGAQTQVCFLQAGGIYTINDVYHPYEAGGRMLQGSFSRILGEIDGDLAVVQSSGDSCRILRLRYLEIIDSMACNDVNADFSRREQSPLTPAQVRGDRYIADFPAESALGRYLASGSLAADGNDVPFTFEPVPMTDSYSRFDPSWLDDTRIIYARQARGQVAEKH